MPDPGQVTEIADAVLRIGVIEVLSLFIVVIAFVIVLAVLRGAQPLLAANARAMESNGEAMKRNSVVSERSIAALETTRDAIGTMKDAISSGGDAAVAVQEALLKRVTEAQTQAAADRDTVLKQLDKAVAAADADRVKQKEEVLKVVAEAEIKMSDGFDSMKHELESLAKQAQSLQDNDANTLDVLRGMATTLESLLRRVTQLEETMQSTQPATPGPREVKGSADLG
ncbi:MAG: hypothetical protein SGJ24_04460 [Chloroflexota bacterium]|nr:hypothetical protein [Chloroflexota bacterium]